VLGLALGALLFLDGALSLGTIYVIFAYTQMLTYPVEQILRQLSDLQQATASVGRVQALFDTRSSLIQKPPAKTTALPSGALSVTVSQVTFAYPGDDAVLHDVSVHVSAGSTLGVLGRTGSGKTTLTRLLLRLYDPASGAVRIGDVDLRETYNADLRQRITIVTQDVQLFSASVRDNLTLFDESIADAQIQNALAAVGLADWAAALPHGLNTLLSAGSTSLSAGEAQLLAFARAFLRNPGLVILDEASSRLDPATEQKLEQAVDKLLAGRTGIIIAHRLRTLDRVQQILILEDGRVIENGARAVLVRDANSRFAQLLHTGIEQALV
jgi:ATP-binding cassette subfamily B protein